MVTQRNSLRFVHNPPPNYPINQNRLFLKISIVTAVYNCEATLADAIESVSAQNYDNIEYIVVDGNSSDSTAEIVSRYHNQIDISIRESDKGIYDALNKGIDAATGDIVGFLHADDLLNSADSIGHIAKQFDQESIDAVYGDLLYVSFEDPTKIVRYWKSGPFNRAKFRYGWMPPHPTVFVKKRIYQSLGNYRIDLGSAADYECMVRLLHKNKLNVNYAPYIINRMRVGGESNASIKNRLKANTADRNAWVENGLKPPFGLRFTKPLRKVPQFFLRPPKST